ncbi:MAG: hypothetical protein US76_01220 [Parcubacteria group bacterium GW2011_GWA2_38_13b]|nr:MAG: hypothetical protein US76_01220 [Parcubacteria group bacterium GW2011_GWA2_38_13b]
MTWDYDDKNYQQQAAADSKWLLQRMLTGEGLKGRKIARAALEKYLPEIKLPENAEFFWSYCYGTRNFKTMAKTGAGFFGDRTNDVGILFNGRHGASRILFAPSLV